MSSVFPIDLEYVSQRSPPVYPEYPNNLSARFSDTVTLLSSQHPAENIILVTHGYGVTYGVRSLCNVEANSKASAKAFVALLLTRTAILLTDESDSNA
jgi:hypothetical protein